MGSEQGIIIHDVNKTATTKFREQLSHYGPIKVVNNGAEAFQAAVRVLITDIARLIGTCFGRRVLYIDCSLGHDYHHASNSRSNADGIQRPKYGNILSCCTISLDREKEVAHRVRHGVSVYDLGSVQDRQSQRYLIR